MLINRTKQFISGIITSYINIFSNIIFTLLSVPLALKYLEKEEFGIWALVLQIQGYLILIDIGMNSATGRYLAEYKDQKDKNNYGIYFTTGACVFLIQGILLSLIGVIFSYYAPYLLSIPEIHAKDFRILLCFTSISTGLSVWMRAFDSPLWAHQRSDIINTCGTINTAAGILLLAIGFEYGLGIYSFVLSSTIPLIFVFCFTTYICYKNNYYPKNITQLKPNLYAFKRIFNFGKDTAFVNLGLQIVNASQIIIISAFISLESAATYAVATKFYSLAMRLSNTPMASAAPALAEMYVRGERESFSKRYWDLIHMILVIGAISGMIIATGNRSLLNIWTNGAINWNWMNDVVLGILIVLRNINSCMVGVYGLAKNWRPVRFLYMIEALLFIPIGIFMALHYGILGLLIASLFAHLITTTIVGIKAASAIIGLDGKIIWRIGWTIGSIIIISIIGRLLNYKINEDLINLIYTAFSTIITTAMIWIYVIPNTLKIEITQRGKVALKRII